MDILRQMDLCNVTYHELGETDRSAMPLGNGNLGASVWVNQEGQICLYLARNDALTEYDRNVKLGMVQITCTPNPFTSGRFEQELKLTDGLIEIRGENAAIQIFAGRQRDTLYILGKFEQPAEVRAIYRTWRTRPAVPTGEYIGPCGVWEEPDTVEYRDGRIYFCHKNGKTVVRETAKQQGFTDASMELIPDSISGRVFGGLMGLAGAKRRDACTLVNGQVRSLDLRIATGSTLSGENFADELCGEWQNIRDPYLALEEVKAWWREYWQKSYIFVEHDDPVSCPVVEELEAVKKETAEYSCGLTSNVTKAYVFTKYMTACCSGGEFPIYYNGMLFQLCPGERNHYCRENFGRVFTAQPHEIDEEYNPDERSWCQEQLWQNVRHPYHSMLARGETEPVRRLFSYYRRFWRLNRYRADRYYQAEGQHNTEMTMSFGLQSMGIYGKDREGIPQGYAVNRWGGAVDISPGLELSMLMLDYYQFTKDEAFLRDEAVTYIKDLLRYIETRFPKKSDGVMQIGPLNSVETYRDTINPLPVAAGLHAVLDRLLELGPEKTGDGSYFKDYWEKIPPLPVGGKDKERLLMPAQGYQDKRYNVEIPELYACFPFRLFGIGKADRELAVRTYRTRTEEFGLRKCFRIGETPDEPSYSGWQYLGVVAAILGLTREAEDILTHNCALQNPGCRFPGMWGPVYDAVPDVDHGANILNQLQKMVLQTEGDQIYLLPAFPKKWDVSFRLYADAATTVEAEYRGGKITKLSVSPEDRRKDIVFQESFPAVQQI